MTSRLADTHAVVWYLTDSPRLSPAARDAMAKAIDGGFPVLVSVITLVELTYLVERGRMDSRVRQLLVETLGRQGSGLQPVPFGAEMAEVLAQVSRGAVPDMPDRMIAATALWLGIPLVTADARLRNAGLPVIW